MQDTVSFRIELASTNGNVPVIRACSHDMLILSLSFLSLSSVNGGVSGPMSGIKSTINRTVFSSHPG